MMNNAFLGFCLMLVGLSLVFFRRALVKFFLFTDSLIGLKWGETWRKILEVGYAIVGITLSAVGFSVILSYFYRLWF